MTVLILVVIGLIAAAIAVEFRRQAQVDEWDFPSLPVIYMVQTTGYPVFGLDEATGETWVCGNIYASRIEWTSLGHVDDLPDEYPYRYLKDQWQYLKRLKDAEQWIVSHDSAYPKNPPSIYQSSDGGFTWM